MTTAEQYAEEQAREWSTYVARGPIDYYGVRAYNAGDPVPASAVAPDGWVPERLVQRVGDDAAAFAGSSTVVDPGPPTIDDSTVAAPAAAPAAPTTEV